MSTVAASPLPRWDLTPAYPGLDSPELVAAMAKLTSGIARLDKDIDAGAEFDAVIVTYNELQDLVELLDSYITNHTNTDSRDDLAAARLSELEIASVPLQAVAAKLIDWLGKQPIDGLLGKSQIARDHRFALEKAHESAKHQMAMPEEQLAADMSVTSASAWSKLYDNLTSQIEVDVEVKGDLKQLPMSSVRNLAYERDRDTRRAAYQAELAAWKANEVPIAACLNSIKGHVLGLCERRRWASPLDEAVFHSNIDRATLEALTGAVQDFLPTARRYYKAKAKALGVQQMAFYDIFAPIGREGKKWELDTAKDFIAKQFRKYSDKMGDLAERSYRENWIDWESRSGKVGGAYCSGFVKDSSRILMNFKPAFGNAMTLAHELGHAYHNLCLFGRTALQRETPMTLAETASIFCETIVKNAAMEEFSEEEKFSLLEETLQGDCQTVVDICSRYLFENRVFEERKKRELSPKEFCALMRQAQLDTYGDGLDSELLHPYMWAAKGHYYTTYSFYNYPYTFGRLFGLGLYARYEADPAGFKAGYDELLSWTGMADAAALAERFGIDIRSKAFWASSLALIGQDIDQFEGLV
jgi:pepF/M3 family oligoendopeptidase